MQAMQTPNVRSAMGITREWIEQEKERVCLGASVACHSSLQAWVKDRKLLPSPTGAEFISTTETQPRQRSSKMGEAMAVVIVNLRFAERIYSACE